MGSQSGRQEMRRGEIGERLAELRTRLGDLQQVQRESRPLGASGEQRAIAIAAHAITQGDAPYGSLLAGADGAILIEAHNTVRRDNDISAHPELKLARWAARELTPEAAAQTTMYTSCQPCGMCAGGIARSGLGRVVYALATEQLLTLNPGSQWPPVAQEGPALFDEARVPIEEYYQP